MYAVIVTFTIKPQYQGAFLPLVIENARQSRGEAACQQFDVCANSDTPETVFLYEIYDDKAGFETHLETAHFLEFNRIATDMIEEKQISTYTQVVQ
ncbi:antibiotic biosynthesis monooxygenase [Amylibacter marinus]|uniref:Antibiotic biosynthesis monooxygenase n=1 Tax=Amylibacter marinus TaxID=1475483 RepID=A0ABQ5VY59_9RHOB|nr:putative quinol monooxygenase [Amylibacter marinus]GLQ36026.1 antibiotic biosynthesis monooxygenase [Amylibacter marinus]